MLAIFHSTLKFMEEVLSWAHPASFTLSTLQVSLFVDAVIKYIQNGADWHKFILRFIEYQRRKLPENIHAICGIAGRAVHLNACILKDFVSVGCIHAESWSLKICSVLQKMF